MNSPIVTGSLFSAGKIPPTTPVDEEKEKETLSDCETDKCGDIAISKNNLLYQAHYCVLQVIIA